jgi:hypothetical protein
MASRSRLLLGVAACFPLLGAACDEQALPGTLLGTYTVDAQSQTNSCGLDAPNPWQFDVQMSQDGELLYWSWMDGTPAVSAPLSGSVATLLASQQANVDGVDGGLGPCNMERDDTLQVTLGSGSPPSTFTGTIAYAFSVTAGSDCSDQLGSAGGQYAQLPCTVTYAASGTRQ